MSVTVNVKLRGAPSTGASRPMLERMSLRTMPDSSSTSGPFEPSPGYGPAVSSGISSEGRPLVAVPAPEEDVDEPDVDALADVEVPDESALPQAASAVAPKPRPTRPRIERRLTKV